MKKILVVLLTLLIMALSACGTSNATANPQSDSASGDLPAITKVAVGTLKLDETDNAITPEQASTLLPLWQVYQSLLESDTSAQEEITALAEQIGTTMTSKQSQTINDMQITQQDVFGVMQAQGMAEGGPQTGSNTQSDTGNFTPPGGGTGLGPPDGGGGLPGGGPDGATGQSLSTDQIATAKASGGARSSGTPTALIEAVIQYLKEKAGS